MNHRRCIPLLGIMAVMATVNTSGFDQSITGSAKTKLSGPMTGDQTAACKRDAKYKLKPELIQLLEEQKNIIVDTTDLLTNLLLDNFLDSCVTRAKSSSSFTENYWVFSYTITPEAVEAALTGYNKRIELLATHSWKRLENAINRKNNEELYYQSVETIAYATAYLGPPLSVPEGGGKVLIEEARGALKRFLERLSISNSGYVIEGKPGHRPATLPAIRITIDDKPFAGLGFIGYIPGGIDLFTGATDSAGCISFENFVIPFVGKGAMMYVNPNLGRVINNKWRIGIHDFGLKLKKDLNQTFFFKLEKPSFTLRYEAVSTDPTQPLPPDITSGVLIKRYLTDSCWLRQANDSAHADLLINIKCEIASAGSGNSERGGARFTGNVVVQAPTLTPPRTETETINFEKRYTKSLIEIKKKKEIIFQVPIGTFLWDSNLVLNGTIRKILNRL